MTETPQDPIAGILLYSGGVFLFSLNDALGKWLVADYGVAQLMALRAIGAMLVLAPALIVARARFSGPHRWGLQALRVALSTADTYCFYFSTRSLPLADVMTFYLAAPLIVVALSGMALRERVGVDRWAAVLLGFVGVLIALHPSGAAISVGALVALLGSTLFASTLIITRQLRGTPWLELVAVQVIGSGVVGAVIAPADWIAPAPVDVGLMFVVGIVSMGCFMCLTKALALTAASRLAPLQYMSIVWAALIGWLVWGDLPSGAVTLGIGVIVASGLLVLRSDRRELAAG